MSAARSESTLGRSLVASLVAAVPLAFGSPAHAWQRVLAGGSGSIIHSGVAVVQSPDGKVFVGGRIQFEGHREFGLASTHGSDLWSRNLGGGTGSRTVPSPAIARDAAGDVIVGVNRGRVFAIHKLSATTGTDLWVYELDSPGCCPSPDLECVPFAVTVDGNGDVVAAGRTFSSATGFRFTVVKLAGITGSELWRYQTDGDSAGLDMARAVAVDSANDVLATGRIEKFRGAGLQPDMLVVKLSALTGAEVWRREVFNGCCAIEEGNAIAVDGSNHVLVAGTQGLTGIDMTFAVRKFDGITGADIWSRF